MSKLKLLKSELYNLANKEQAQNLQRFFKTGKGQYGEGDIFLGIKAPVQRQVAKKYPDLTQVEIQELLKSKIHEERLVALLILMNQYRRGDESKRERLVKFYLKNTKRVNNWDLVDLSCHRILGHYLLNRPRQILYRLAKSSNLWEKRIAIISTAAFIAVNDFSDTIKISEILLCDQHDLIHKAVGWMLREAGKRDIKILEKFLDKHSLDMPRTMLRYAIEKLSREKRQYYLKK